jgi:hypothetical protein
MGVAVVRQRVAHQSSSDPAVAVFVVRPTWPTRARHAHRLQSAWYRPKSNE